MHIVHWAKFYPPEWGGMEAVVHDLVLGMAGDGTRSSVVAFSRDRGLPDREEPTAGVSVHRAPVAATISSQPLSPRWAAKALGVAHGADCVVIHSPNPFAVVPLLALRLRGLLTRQRPRIVLFWHADIVGKRLAGALVRPLEHLMALLSDRIIATSPPYAASSPVLARHHAKVRVAPLGTAAVDPQPASRLPDRVRTFIGARPVLLAIGRLVPYKGFATLIRAAGLVERDFALLIVGEGPLEAELRASIEGGGLADRVMLTGRLEAPQLAAALSCADAFVMASLDRAEAFGVVLIEAMSTGRPIIATDIAGSGVPWVVDAVARLVPPGDAAAMAQAIAALLADPQAAAGLGEAARARFSAQFTREAMVRGFSAVLAEALAG